MGTYVLTGATSGFGALALKQLAETTDHPIIVGARNIDALADTYGDRVRVLPLDLSSLENVTAFCKALEGTSIAVLGLNAGMQTRKLTHTVDGFETTFQVNYLSHFFIFKTLKAQLTEDARIITTGSGTHDPEEKTPVPPPRHVNIPRLARPETDPKRDAFRALATARAYSTSKLLCILMAMEIARRYPHLNAASFDPGYLPDTKLTREYPALLANFVKWIIPHTMKHNRSGTSATTAPEYTRTLLGESLPDENGGYIVMRAGKSMTAKPSKFARQPGLAERVWDETLKLI